jgi:transposase
MWAVRGETPEIPAPGQNEKIPLYGALNYRTNRVTYRLGDGKTARDFLGFLAQLVREYQGHHCLLVLDNATYHTAAVVRRYLDELESTFRVLWLPPYSPELNDIERIWKFVKGASLANYDFGKVCQLRDAIVKTFTELNRGMKHDLTIHFRDPLSKNLLRVA